MTDTKTVQAGERTQKSYKIEYRWRHRDATRGGSSYTVRAETEAEAIQRGKAAFERDFDNGYTAWFQDGSEIKTGRKLKLQPR